MLKFLDKKFLPDFVYGSIDGIITTFAVVAGVEGGGLSPSVILILGLSNLVADGFSMGVSKYLSEKTETGSKYAVRKAFFGGVMTFVAFLVLGAVPLLVYLYDAVFDFSGNNFVWTIILTSLALALVGFLKSYFLNESRIKASLETLILGGLAAAIAYLIGFLLSYMLGV